MCEACPYQVHHPETPDGAATWSAIQACGSQIRATEGGAYAWDFPAVLQVGALTGADLPLLAELLSTVEPFVVRAWQKD